MHEWNEGKDEKYLMKIVRENKVTKISERERVKNVFNKDILLIFSILRDFIRKRKF